MLRVQRRKTTAVKGSRFYPALWTLVAGCLLSASASAASHVRSDCKGAEFLKSAAEPKSLTLDVVELGDSLRDPDTETAVDLLSIDPDDSPAPLLYLAPRVATILENVFDDDSDDPGLLDDESSDTAFAEKEDRSIELPQVSPVAERRAPAVIHDSEHSALIIEPAYLKIHRQMYRTDI